MAAAGPGSRRPFMSSPNRPYGFHVCPEQRRQARRSASASWLAHFGSARTCCASPRAARTCPGFTVNCENAGHSAVTARCATTSGRCGLTTGPRGTADRPAALAPRGHPLDYEPPRPPARGRPTAPQGTAGPLTRRHGRCRPRPHFRSHHDHRQGDELRHRIADVCADRQAAGLTGFATGLIPTSTRSSTA